MLDESSQDGSVYFRNRIDAGFDNIEPPSEFRFKLGEEILVEVERRRWAGRGIDDIGDVHYEKVDLRFEDGVEREDGEAVQGEDFVGVRLVDCHVHSH